MGKNIGRLIAKAESIIAKQQAERERAIQLEEEAERERIRKQEQEEYDRPLPEFPPRIPREIRVRLLTYVARVCNDAIKKILLKDVEKTQRHFYSYGPHDIEDAARRSREFRGVPVQEFATAIRLAELKQLSSDGMGGITTVAVLYVLCRSTDKKLVAPLQDRYFLRHVPLRLENNLLKNVPGTWEILGENFEARVYTLGDYEFAELKKSGYEAQPGEEKVVHLEIF